jgi:hypothetical protein
MQGGIVNQTGRIYELFMAAGVGGINAVELKTENDNRSKSMNESHWKSVTAYNAVFGMPVPVAISREASVSGTLTLSLRSTFDPTDRVVLNSIVGNTYPNGLHNRFPSLLLAISEWVIEDVVRAINGGAMYPWLHPTVNFSDTPSAVPFTYVVEFRLEGRTSDKGVVEGKLISSIAALATRRLSHHRGLTMSDVFDMSPGTDLLTIGNPNASSHTDWDFALRFPDVDAGNNDQWAVSRSRASPLQRGPYATAAPRDGYTAAGSQPWAVATVFNRTSHTIKPLTLLAMADAPTLTANHTGIWLTIEDRSLVLRVGESGESWAALTHTDAQGAYLGTDRWVGLSLVWNGHQSTTMASGDFKKAYILRSVDLVTGSVTDLNWNGFNIVNGGGVHAIDQAAARHLVGSGAMGDSGFGEDSRHVFRGSIASHVATTLLAGVLLPTISEVAEMVRSPLQWIQTHKVGKDWRPPGAIVPSASSFATDPAGEQADATKIWLMGDHSATASGPRIHNQSNIDNDAEVLDLIGFPVPPTVGVSIDGLSDASGGGVTDTMQDWFEIALNGDNPIVNILNLVGSPTSTDALRSLPAGPTGEIVVRAENANTTRRMVEWSPMWTDNTELVRGSLNATSSGPAKSFVVIRSTEDASKIFLELYFGANAFTGATGITISGSRMDNVDGSRVTIAPFTLTATKIFIRTDLLLEATP